ncbi:hypothetical protein [Paenibacillus sp. HB172176]|uniref:hypothetical protein n=1 Tax=Paenibacillus sp. HB172176 TaxID=2493690 RepID=UPI00143AF331|nr:hypothetical protein [Paenibacillus sp. HB172176]
MKHGAWKWIMMGVALTIIVLFGIEMSTTGIERIYGPIDGTQAGSETNAAITETAADQSDKASETERRIDELERELERIRKLAGKGADRDWLRDELQKELEEVPPQDGQPAVDKIADSTSGLLQSASTNGIKLVAHLFDGLIN